MCTADWLSTSPRRLLLLAAVLHITLTIGITLLGKSNLTPNTFDSNGVGIAFALDSATYRKHATEMSHLIREGRYRDWFYYRAPLATLHVRIYSISYALLGWVLGEGILAVEPINLFYYLSILILTYSIGASLFSPAVGRLAAVVIGLWPSLLIITTQLLQDPLFICAFLLLLLSLAVCINQQISFKQAFAYTGSGVASLLLVLLARSTMWEIVVAIVCLAALVCIISQLTMRRFDPRKNLAICLICIAAFVLPTIVSGRRVTDRVERAASSKSQVDTPTIAAAPWSRFSQQIGWVRHRFIISYKSAGSNLDTDVELHTTGDVIRYFPRALQIGLLAPFPTMWFSAGKEVGLAGRLIVGAEMLGFYFLLSLACSTVVRERRQMAVWFLFATGVFGCVVLAYAVVNAGALYRLRYPYFIPIILLGVRGFWSYFNKNPRSLRS